MSSMHIQGDLEDRMIALGSKSTPPKYQTRAERVMFVNEATRERLEREESKKATLIGEEIK